MSIFSLALTLCVRSFIFWIMGRLYLMVKEAVDHLIGVDNDECWPNLREDFILRIPSFNVAENLRFVEDIHVAHIIIVLLHCGALIYFLEANIDCLV